MISALARTPRVIAALILREMSTTYGRSAGGYFWVVAEPVGGIAVLSLVFELLLRSPPLGVNFPMFYATGVLPFLCFGELSSKVGAAIRFSKQLLAYPAVTFADAILARFILNAATHILVFYLVMGGLIMFFDTRVVVDYPTVTTAYGLTLALGFGMGVFNCLLFSFFSVYQRIWGIVTRPLFLVSAIIYTFDSLSREVQAILWWNPIVHIVGLMRRGFYPDYPAEYVSVLYVCIWAAVPGMIGLFFLRRYYRVVLYEL